VKPYVERSDGLLREVKATQFFQNADASRDNTSARHVDKSFELKIILAKNDLKGNAFTFESVLLRTSQTVILQIKNEKNPRK
jgi:hypothetical protein